MNESLLKLPVGIERFQEIRNSYWAVINWMKRKKISIESL